MAKKALPLILVTIIVGSVAWFYFTTAGSVSAQSSQQVTSSCLRPSEKDVQACRAQEHQILDSTVRIELESVVVTEDESGYLAQHANGHATIKEGRYLVTHNHYNIPLSMDPDSEVYTSVAIHKANGQLVFKTSLADFSLVLVEDQTLIFDVGQKWSEQMVAAGLHSADYKSWSDLSLQPGMEMAQLDWDGDIAHVDWVSVEAVITGQGTPRLELDNFIKIGASGGAIFWNGYHVANNWARIQDSDSSGQYERAYSIGALNSSLVTAVSVLS